MGIKETLRQLIDDLKPADQAYYMKMQSNIVRQVDGEIRQEMEQNGMPPKPVTKLNSPERK